MYDVYGLGNAIVDTEVNVDDGFLTQHAIAKGHMTLVDSDRMQALLGDLSELPKSRCGGGSAANTIYAVQALGLSTSYACKVADDEPGRFFLSHMADAGIGVNPNATGLSGHSGQCLVLITRDAERTMNTDLGVSSELGENDVDFDRLEQSRYFYVEGYLSSSPVSTQAAIACRSHARRHDVATAVSLSDPSMVEFFRESLTSILGDGVQVVFCNEEEALAWAKTDRLDIAINELKDIAPELYVTLGASGSLAVTGGERKHAPGVESVPVDTTGAGDIYAGACLAARCWGSTPYDAARFANFCAAELVRHYGARLGAQADYRKLRARFS